MENILSNEKYKGDARLQKCYTVDFLSKKRKANEGEVPQYYVEGSHDAIIEPAEWQLVQTEIQRRKNTGRSHNCCSPFSAKLKCGDCGAVMEALADCGTIEVLKQHNVLFHEEAVTGQVFFVMEDGDIRTHHIHIVKWDGVEWNNYINFRDYLNANPEKAMVYDDFKQKLAAQFSNDRKSYTAGKQEIIDQLIN